MNVSLKTTLLLYFLILPFLGKGQEGKETTYYWSDFPAEKSLEQLKAFKAIYYEKDTSIKSDDKQRIAFFRKAFDAAEELDANAYIAFFGLKLSDDYIALDSFSLAVYYSKQVIEVDADTISVARGYNTLGYTYINLGDYTNALKALFSAVQYGKMLNNGWESYPFGNIVTVYKNLEDYDNAIKYIRLSLEIDNQADFPDREYGLVYSYSYLMQFYQKLGKLDSCFAYIDVINENIAAIDTFKRMYFKDVINFAYATIADFYLTVNSLDLAKTYIDRGSRIVTNYNRSDNLLYLEGRYWVKKRDFDKAKDIIKKYETLNVQNFNSIERLQKLKIEYYTATDNLDKVIEIQKELLETQKEKFGDDRLRFSTFANAEYETLEKQQQIEKLENEKSLDALKDRNRIIIALILLVGFGIWIFTMYRWRRQKEIYTKELEHKNEQLKDIDEAKTRFFANISHELKTPLTLIINPLQKVLKNQKLDTESQYLLQSASKNSLQLFDLVYQILDLMKFEKDKVEVYNTSIRLNQTFEKLHGDFAPLAASRNIDFTFQNNTSKDLCIEIDEYKLTTVFKNLLSNAIKFTSDGGKIRISIDEKADNLVIQIADTGRGIHPKDLPHVFDRYYQSKVSGDIMEGGTGIGLAICKEYVELMGGSIRAESVFGQGSTFIVRLPKIVADAPALSIAQNAPIFNTIPFATSNENNHLATVLVVEDNLSMQDYLKVILQPNYNVITASHGKAALDILNKNPNIDLIISDLMMPEMNGYELVNHLKNTPKFAAIPTIMLTAMSGTDEKLKALRIGIDDYIVKPFVDEELLARIDNLITFSENRQTQQQEIAIEAKTENKTNAPKNVVVTLEKADLEWLEMFEKIVKENYPDPNFKIDAFTEELLTNRSKLYQNVKQFTGLTPRNYINEVRFRAARELIETKPNLTVKAIAYKVGFRDEKYFARNFKKRFGKYPSDYLE